MRDNEPDPGEAVWGLLQSGRMSGSAVILCEPWPSPSPIVELETDYEPFVARVGMGCVEESTRSDPEPQEASVGNADRGPIRCDANATCLADLRLHLLSRNS